MEELGNWLGGWVGRDEREAEGERGLIGVLSSSTASSRITGHFSSREWRTHVHPSSRRASEPDWVLEMRLSA